MNIKKISSGILCVLVFASIFLSMPAARAVELEKAVPADVSAVLFLNYAKNNFYEKCLKFFNQIATLEDKKSTDALREKVGIEFNDPKFLASIGGVAAVYFDDMIKTKPSASENPAAIILKMANKDAFMINLQNFKAAMSKESPDNEYSLFAQKGSLEAEIIEKKDKSEYFAFVVRDDLLIGGFGSKTALNSIGRILETVKKQDGGLAETPGYKRAISVISADTPIYFYLCGDFVKKYAAEESLLPDLDYVSGACFSLNVDGDIITADGAIITDKDNPNNAFTKYFSFEGEQLKAPAMLDNDTMLYFGGRVHLDPKIIAEDKDLKDVKKHIQENLGVDFEKDIMPWAAEEFFIAFSSYKALPLPVMPAPKIYFGIKSKDKAACEKCMQQMLPSLNLKDLKKDTISDINYYFSPVPTPNNIMPEFGLTLAYVNDFLIFASSKDALNPLIAAMSKPEKSLSLNAEFTKGLGALLKSSIFTSYYNNALASDFIHSVLQMTPEYKLGELETDVLKLINVVSGGFTFRDAALRFRFTLSVNKEIYNKILSPEWIKKAGSQK